MKQMPPKMTAMLKTKLTKRCWETGGRKKPRMKKKMPKMKRKRCAEFTILLALP